MDSTPQYNVSNMQAIQFLGIPIPTAQPGTYALKKAAQVGMSYFFKCPQCNRQILFNHNKAEIKRVKCESCGANVLVRVIMVRKTEIPKAQNNYPQQPVPPQQAYPQQQAYPPQQAYTPQQQQAYPPQQVSQRQVPPQQQAYPQHQAPQRQVPPQQQAYPPQQAPQRQVPQQQAYPQHQAPQRQVPPQQQAYPQQQAPQRQVPQQQAYPQHQASQRQVPPQQAYPQQQAPQRQVPPQQQAYPPQHTPQRQVPPQQQAYPPQQTPQRQVPPQQPYKQQAGGQPRQNKPATPQTNPGTVVLGGNRKLETGMLEWGGMWSKKRYVLQEGENWIGRFDNMKTSNVMVNDDFMSRRSACIEVVSQKGAFSFKFTVYKTLNPVKVNGRELVQNQSVYLNYNDYIVMGKTTFTFKPLKK